MEKVLFCDIGNVLLFFDLFRSINRFLAMGSKPARAVLPIVFHGSFIEDFEIGKVSPNRFYKEACRAFGMKLSYETFCRIWNDIFEENFRMTRWIKEVSASHRVYLITNSNHLHYEAVYGRYDFFRYVAGSVASHQTGLRKPDPRIFFHALRMAGVKARQAFYLDDIWGHVFAARRCGMHAEHYTVPAVTQEAWKAFLAK